MMDTINLVGSSKTAKRRELDFYPTPTEVTQGLINTGLIPEGLIWEPCCGDGDMSEVLKDNGFNVYSTDIRETSYADKSLDFFEGVSNSDFFSSIITNPPFNLSADIIEASTHNCNFVAMLLKSQYWHASKRTKLFKENPPAYVFALTWRPDFYFKEKNRKGSPTMECIWCVWIKGDNNTKYRVMEKPNEK